MPAPIKMLAPGDRRAIDRMRVWTAAAIAGHRLPWLEQSRAFLGDPGRGRNYFQVCHVLGRAGFMQRRRSGLYCELVRLPVVGRTSVYRIAGALMNEAPPTQ